MEEGHHTTALHLRHCRFGEQRTRSATVVRPGSSHIPADEQPAIVRRLSFKELHGRDPQLLPPLLHSLLQSSQSWAHTFDRRLCISLEQVMSKRGRGRGYSWFNNGGYDYERVTVALPLHVREQDGPSCVFNAIAHIVESQKKGLVIDVKSYLKAYIDETGVPFGQDKNRAITALNLLRDKGVLASYNGRRTRLNIAGYECQRRMNEYQVFAMLDAGIPLLGSFPARDGFSDLGDRIYELNPPHKYGHAKPGTHIVLFVGYGMMEGRPFLVFLNSYGPGWGTGGLGAVFFDQMLQHDDDKGFQLIRVTVDGDTPAPRLQT